MTIDRDRRRPVPPHRAEWQAYPCDVCTAGPGDTCVTYSGNRKFEPHAARALLAKLERMRAEATRTGGNQ